MFQLVERLLLRAEVARLFNLQNFFRAETPLARWDNYRRFRQRSAIQAIPVRVEEFVKGVRDPSPDELNKFFAENKNRLADPNSPEVGLRTPARASFQLAYIDIERLVSSFKPRIENKAISEYYEKNKHLFEKSKLPAINTTPAIDPTPSSGDTKQLTPSRRMQRHPSRMLPQRACGTRGTVENGTGQVRANEIGSDKVGSTKGRSSEDRSSEDRSSEDRSSEDRSSAAEPAKSEPAAPKPTRPRSKALSFAMVCCQ